MNKQKENAIALYKKSLTDKQRESYKNDLFDVEYILQLERTPYSDLEKLPALLISMGNMKSLRDHGFQYNGAFWSTDIVKQIPIVTKQKLKLTPNIKRIKLNGTIIYKPMPGL